MKKIICDVCGEEIQEHYYKLILRVVQGTIPTEETFDACIKCKVKTIQFIRMLQGKLPYMEKRAFLMSLDLAKDTPEILADMISGKFYEDIIKTIPQNNKQKQNF